MRFTDCTKTHRQVTNSLNASLCALLFLWPFYRNLMWEIIQCVVKNFFSFLEHLKVSIVTWECNSRLCCYNSLMYCKYRKWGYVVIIYLKILAKIFLRRLLLIRSIYECGVVNASVTNSLNAIWLL